MGLVLPITCGICQQKFTAPAVADLITSQTGQARLGTVLETLVAHIKEQHKPAYQVAALQSAQMLHLICLMQFLTEDQGAIQLRDFMRYQLWSSLQKNRPGTDEELERIVAQMGVSQAYRGKVLDILKQCRDIWCEMGKFQPQPLIQPPQNGKPQ